MAVNEDGVLATAGKYCDNIYHIILTFYHAFLNIKIFGEFQSQLCSLCPHLLPESPFLRCYRTMFKRTIFHNLLTCFQSSNLVTEHLDIFIIHRGQWKHVVLGLEEWP
jgi:hypothetical protein